MSDRSAREALERVARVLDGHPTYIGENGHVCLHTLEEKRND